MHMDQANAPCDTMRVVCRLRCPFPCNSTPARHLNFTMNPNSAAAQTHNLGHPNSTLDIHLAAHRVLCWMWGPCTRGTYSRGMQWWWVGLCVGCACTRTSTSGSGSRGHAHTHTLSSTPPCDIHAHAHTVNVDTCTHAHRAAVSISMCPSNAPPLPPSPCLLHWVNPMLHCP